MGLRDFFVKNLKTLRTIRMVLAILLTTMIIIDIVLVMLGEEYPTFSEIVKEHRSELLWLNFLMAGLIAKVFYNRKVYTKKREISGFFTFLAIVALLFIIGRLENFKIGGWYQVAVMISGAIVGQRIWPQYVNYEEPE